MKLTRLHILFKVKNNAEKGNVKADEKDWTFF